MNITIEKAIELSQHGTATVLRNGKIYFKKEKVVRRQPSDSMVLQNINKLNIPRFF